MLSRRILLGKVKFVLGFPGFLKRKRISNPHHKRCRFGECTKVNRRDSVVFEWWYRDWILWIFWLSFLVLELGGKILWKWQRCFWLELLIWR